MNVAINPGHCSNRPSTNINWFGPAAVESETDTAVTGGPGTDVQTEGDIETFGHTDTGT